MDKLTIRYLQPEEFSDWEDFVRKNKEGTLFHHYYWYEFVFSQNPRVKLSVIGCYISERLVAGAVLAVKKRGIFNFVVSPFATPFYGILIEDRESAYSSKKESFRLKILTNLLDYLQKKHHFLTFSLTPGFGDIRGFSWKHFTGQVKYTYRTSLSDMDGIYTRFLPALKRQIKKGDKLQYRINKSLDRVHLRISYDLILKSYKRQGHPFKFSFSQMEKLLENEKIKKNIRIYSIWLEEVPVSTIILIVDQSCSYYWLAGGDYQYFSSGLNQLLIWKVLQELAHDGVKCFDFVGANTNSITQYKSSFNFDLVPYYQVSKATPFFLRLLLFLKGISA